MSDNPTTVGEYLRKIRTERGVSLEQVAQATRVKLTYLQAIEQDEPSELPSVVQARGFIRLYAGYLDLPAQPLLDGWASGHLEIPEESETEVEVEAETGPSPSSEPELANEETPGPESEPEPEEIPAEFEAEESGPEADIATPEPGKGRQSQEIFSRIGAQLRERREMLHLSLEDAERFTRLRGRHLQALEEGRMQDLPSPVQGRGMLSNYAEFLDLDTEDILLQFADGLQARRLELGTEQNSLKRRQRKNPAARAGGGKPSGVSRFLTLDLVLGGGLFIFLIGFVLWGAGRVINLQREAAVPTPPSISEILMTPDANLPTATLEVTPTATGPAVVEGEVPPIGVGGEVDQPTEIILPTPGSAPISITIVASQRAWMRVTVDTSVAFEGRVVPGNAYPFNGRERIDLVTGNGAALSVIYNNTELGTLGTMGEVVSISFTRDGTLVPTPTATATPTPTLTPTPTRQPTEPLITPSITPLVP